MKRRLFTLLSVLSLVLCVATTALWVRSYWTADEVTHFKTDPERRRAREYAVQHDCGAVHAHNTVWDFQTPEGFQLLLDDLNPDYVGWDYFDHSPQPELDLGFYTRTKLSVKDAIRIRPAMESLGTFTIERRSVGFPYWPLVLLLGLPVVPIVIRRLRSLRQPKEGHCPACGYDLRATPHRCPECGAVPGS